MKHILISLSVLLLSNMAMAIPIVNENVANRGMIMIYPDHADANRFYIAPNVVKISMNEEGIPNFSYDEYRKHLFTLVGVIQMTLMPAYTQADLKQAEAEILVKNPKAEFSGLPFIESQLEMSGDLPQIIAGHECNHKAGVVGQEQACSMILTSRGRYLFLSAMERKTIFTTLQFSYSFAGVVKLADGTYRDQMIQHGIAARIDGAQLGDFPNLVRSYGP